MLSLAAMKLELALGIAALLAVAGCASSQPAHVVEAPKPVVATTHTMAAELTEASEASDAPKVGKSQHSIESVNVDDTQVEKDLPQRRTEHRHGGGFSGYK